MMTPEQKQKMVDGARLRREALARGENPPLSRGAKRRRARKAEAAAAATRMAEAPAISEEQRKVDEFPRAFGHPAAFDAPRLVEASPDFKAALDAALAERLPAMFAALAQANGHARDQSPESFAKALALQMAKFTGQGVGKTYVDPEELEKRTRGRVEMLRLIKECRETQQIPTYRIIRQTQLDVPPFGPIIVEPLWRGADRVARDTEIDFLWIPNLAMAPLNDVAKLIYAQFEIWIGAEMPEVADPEGLDSPIAVGPPTQLGRYALSHTGAVVRGAAAEAAMRQAELRGAMGPMSPHQAAVIRRGEDPATRKKQVLGTLTDPIEMR